MQQLLILLLLIYLSIIHATDQLFYTYFINNQANGMTSVTYQKLGGQYLKKQYKYIKASQSREELTAILNKSYALESVNLVNNKKHTTITVGEQIVFQTNEKIFTCPKEICYLDISDFLKFLVMSKKTEFGKVYRGKVLASTQDKFIIVRARCMRQAQVSNCFRKTLCHTYKVTTEELNNFWADANVDLEGNLIGYTLGSFQMLLVPEIYAKSVELNRLDMKTMYIFQNDSIEKMLLQFSENVPDSILNTELQTIKDSQILLLAPPDIQKKKTVLLSNLLKESSFLQEQPYLPLHSPNIVKLANELKKNESNALQIMHNILQWISIHLGEKFTKEGKSLANFLGMPSDVHSVLTAVLCRACGIPAKLTAGLYYSLGNLHYATWCAVYLDSWYIVYNGKFQNGACFLNMYDNTHWDWNQNHKILETNPQILGIVTKKGQEINFLKTSTYFKIQQNNIEDLLLGIRFQCPEEWILLPKKPTQDTIYFRALQGKGPIILLKTVVLPKSMDELLLSIAKKMGVGETVELLWQQPRTFAGGKAIEVALKVTKQNLIYRAFLGECNQRGLLALLMVASNDLMSVEKDFEKFLDSLEMN